MDAEKEYTFEREIPKLNEKIEVDTSSQAHEEITITTKSIKIPEDVEEGWYTVKVRIYEREDSTKMYDECEAYRFYVSDGMLKLSPNIEKSSSIKITANLTDYIENPIQNANTRREPRNLFGYL